MLGHFHQLEYSSAESELGQEFPRVYCLTYRVYVPM